MNPDRPKSPNRRSIDGFRRGDMKSPQSPVSRPAAPPPVQSSQQLQREPVPDAMPKEAPSAPTLSDSSIPQGNSEKPKPSRRKKLVWGGVLGVVALAIICLAVLYGWYRHEITPVDKSDTKTQTFVVKAGATPHQIGDDLEDKHLIRSSTAFYIYLVLSHQRDLLQAGSYSLAPSQSVPDIVHKLTHGAVSNFSITFYPGGTLSGTLRAEPKYSVTTQLENAGFSAGDVSTAFATNYDEPVLFSGKPAKSSLEGYIYGDTYSFSAGTPASDVIKRSLDEFSSVVAKNNLTALYKKQHLTLYQGITLASIVQRELDEGGTSGPTKDQRQVAQVFLLRLKKHMTLGSDVTYYYGAEQLGVTPSPDIDSPYNTRKHTGLPPGPIATPGLNALLAVAHPASTDYLYFLSGDDGKIYFSKTAEGHQQNIQNHCQKQCQY